MFNSLNNHQQGLSHANKNLPCQDYASSWVSEDKKFSIGVLCDGAGSCKHSDIGAKRVGDYFIEYIKNRRGVDFSNIDEKFNLIRNLQINLMKCASENKCEYKDLSSTFLAVVTEEKDEGIECTSFHIGDGIIAIANGEETKILSAPENGQYANVTVFTTSSKAFSSLRITKGKASLDASFVLMSDGSADCLYSKSAKRFSENINKLHILFKQDNLTQDAFNDFVLKLKEKTKTGDDCSLVFINNRSKSNDALKLSFEKGDIMDKELSLTKKELEEKISTIEASTNKYNKIHICLSIGLLCVSILSIALLVHIVYINH